MPRTAEYCGPVEVGWVGEVQEGASGRRRGLLAARAVAAGELLLASRPIAWAESSGEPLAAALQAAARSSGRARRWLACLADGVQGEDALPLERVNEALRDLADGPVEADAGGAPELDVHGVIKTNAFRTGSQGSSAIYGMPSMCNHSCDGFESAVLRHIRSDGTIVLWAARDFAKGEELRIRYFACDLPLHFRQELSSSHWGFSCACSRCTFERCRLPGSPPAKAVDDATAAWKGGLLQTFQELTSKRPAESSSAEAGAAAAAAERSARALFCGLLGAVSEVEAAAKAQAGWGEAEVAWCLSLVQPLSNAALWCLLARGSALGCDAEAEEEGTGQGPTATAERKCKVLAWIVAALSRGESLGFDHLRNLHLLWSARREVRTAASAGPAGDAAAQAEAEARGQLERACWIRFGVGAEELRLDAADSPVTRLLRSLKL